MSRRKRKSKPPSAGEPPASTGNAGNEGPPNAGAPCNPATLAARRRWFAIAAILVAAWWVVLIGLAAFTANPVTLNRQQVLRAARTGSIVTAEVRDAKAGKVKVLRDWTKGGSGEELIVAGLADSGARDGKTYILPLTTDTLSGRLRIAPAPGPSKTPPVYPASDSAVEQLTAILGKRR